MKDIIFINSHPIQYFTPLYKFLNEQGVTTKAWYCSDESVKGGYDKQFGTEIKWDIPLLEGYEYRFFKNQSWKPSIFGGFFGLINFGLLKALFQIPKSVIVVHGWHYFTHFFVLLLGRLRGHTVCLRCDIPLSQEEIKRGWKQHVKKFGLRYILFSRINFFLFIGNQNKGFYKSYYISDKRLLFSPYAVDNARFREEAQLFSSQIADIRHQHGVATTDKVIIFTAKYINKKRPLELLQAFKTTQLTNCWLFLVGEGELRGKMESFIQENNLTRVVLTGFINQSKISQYYAMSDVFVMCSGEGENWGLSANEAMNFDLPLVLSGLTGCADDLIQPGKNGYIFNTDDVQELSEKLCKALLMDKQEVSAVSKAILDVFSYQTFADNIKNIL